MRCEFEEAHLAARNKFIKRATRPKNGSLQNNITKWRAQEKNLVRNVCSEPPPLALSALPHLAGIPPYLLRGEDNGEEAKHNLSQPTGIADKGAAEEGNCLLTVEGALQAADVPTGLEISTSVGFAATEDLLWALPHLNPPVVEAIGRKLLSRGPTDTSTCPLEIACERLLRWSNLLSPPPPPLREKCAIPTQVKVSFTPTITFICQVLLAAVSSPSTVNNKQCEAIKIYRAELQKIFGFDSDDSDDEDGCLNGLSDVTRKILSRRRETVLDAIRLLCPRTEEGNCELRLRKGLSTSRFSVRSRSSQFTVNSQMEEHRVRRGIAEGNLFYESVPTTSGLLELHPQKVVRGDISEGSSVSLSLRGVYVGPLFVALVVSSYALQSNPAIHHPQLIPVGWRGAGSERSVDEEALRLHRAALSASLRMGAGGGPVGLVEGQFYLFDSRVSVETIIC